MAGLIAVTIAAAALVGWFVGLPLLSSWGAGHPAMQLSGALCLAALCLAFVCASKDQRFAVAIGVTVASLAAFFLGEALLNTSGGIEWLAATSPG